jgi:cation transport ATPase
MQPSVIVGDRANDENALHAGRIGIAWKGTSDRRRRHGG